MKGLDSFVEFILEGLFNLPEIVRDFKRTPEERRELQNNRVITGEVDEKDISINLNNRKWIAALYLVMIAAFAVFVFEGIFLIAVWSNIRLWITVAGAVVFTTITIILARNKSQVRKAIRTMDEATRKEIVTRKLMENYDIMPISILEDDQTVLEMRRTLEEAPEGEKLTAVLSRQAVRRVETGFTDITGIYAASMTGDRDHIREISYLMELPGRYTPGERFNLVCVLEDDFYVLSAKAYENGYILVRIDSQGIDRLLGRKFRIVIARKPGT